MNTAKVFETGRSQAIRLPKEYRFTEKEVGIKKLGDIVLLFPKENTWDIFTSGLKSFSDDFMEDGRNQESAEKIYEIHA